MSSWSDEQTAADVIDVDVRGTRLRQFAPNDISRLTGELAAELEPETLDWIDGFPRESCFFDIGASNGLYTHYAAVRQGAEAYAFEAEAQNYAALEMNSFLNRKAFTIPPKAFNVAICARHSVASLYCARYGAGFHMKILDRPQRVGESDHFEPEHVQPVLAFPLDDLVASFGLPQPQFMKVDVDGAEFDVVRGAGRTLGHPTFRSLMIEISETHESVDELRKWIDRLGLALVARHPVRHARGGHYPGLFNCRFDRRG